MPPIQAFKGSPPHSAHMFPHAREGSGRREGWGVVCTLTTLNSTKAGPFPPHPLISTETSPHHSDLSERLPSLDWTFLKLTHVFQKFDCHFYWSHVNDEFEILINDRSILLDKSLTNKTGSLICVWNDAHTYHCVVCIGRNLSLIFI